MRRAVSPVCFHLLQNRLLHIHIRRPLQPKIPLSSLTTLWKRRRRGGKQQHFFRRNNGKLRPDDSAALLGGTIDSAVRLESN